MSAKEISKLLGCSLKPIYKRLKEYNIPIRSLGDAFRLKKGEDYFVINNSVIDGCLMGDAGLFRENKLSSDSQPYFEKQNKYYDHVLYVSNILFSQQNTERIRKYEEKRCYRLISATHRELMPFYKRWYPDANNYKKIVPDDLIITPEFLLHWFLDDGYSCYVRRSNSVSIALCTLCFEYNELNKLCDKILKHTGLKATVRQRKKSNIPRGTGCEIFISEKDTNKFFDFIGPCPVDSLAYKWKFKNNSHISQTKLEELKNKQRQNKLSDKNPNYKNFDIDKMISVLKNNVCINNKELAKLMNVSSPTLHVKINKKLGLTLMEVREKIQNDKNFYQ